MSSDQHLAEARRLISATTTMEDLELAARHLREVLKRNPNDSEALSLNAQSIARLKAIRDQSGSSHDSASSDSEQSMTPADKFALNLVRTFRNNGYDIDARIDIDKSLVLTSDFFQDASTRETEVAELWKERTTLCSMDIWYVKVGYSKGMFSGDVRKSISLGCLAEKTAYAAEMAPEREKAAASLSVDGVRASVTGTTLSFESDYFSEATFRSQFVQRLEDNPDVRQANCRLAFAQIQLTYKGKVVRTVPVRCE
jgi:hypothetical protein